MRTTATASKWSRRRRDVETSVDAGATDPVAANAQLLTRQAGGYLRNAVRERFVTCSVCCTPVDGYERCYRCSRDWITGVADLVAPLAYGVERAQSGILLRHYKDDVSAEARRQHTHLIRRLLYVAIMKHQMCIEKQVGMSAALRVTVPSLKHRRGVHPFTALAQAMRAVDDARLALRPASGAVNDRIVSATQFEIVPQRSLNGQHVMILDDT